MEEVKKSVLEFEYLSVKFQLLHKELEHMQECEVQMKLFYDELRMRQTPRYDFIRILVIVVLCFILKCYVIF